MEGREGGVPSTAAAEGAGIYQPPPPPPSASPAATVVRDEKSACPVGVTATVMTAAASTAAAVVVGTAAATPVAEPMKKKRGRPRKYGPDGRLLQPLNPLPISASVPSGVEYTPAAAVGAAIKRGRGRPVGLVSKSPRYGLDFEPLGDMVACSAGTNFTPHIITVASGEDVTMKIISFSQQGSRAICILSANGVISNVTLRQPDSSGGTLTYEGRFELLSLSGSFMPTENGGTRSRSGGLSVSLASPDGRVVGGGVAGLLVAASPVQVVVGSFVPSYQMEQKIKKPRSETGLVPPPTSAIPVSSAAMEEACGSAQGKHTSSTSKPDPSTASSFQAESWAASLQSAPGDRNSTDINISLTGS
ncbi:AT-hook motif nuclear-localized protein 1-like [Musa acuminata AAA Group]|uniref:AT-hook motif nuclear-localized protein 1-like n=1 Tax=Musa acuminata AAA Group TaxID=214697 RepID=UPI0031D564B7